MRSMWETQDGGNGMTPESAASSGGAEEGAAEASSSSTSAEASNNISTLNESAVAEELFRSLLPKLTLKAIKEQLEMRGLPAKGKKDELLESLENAIFPLASSASPPPVPDLSAETECLTELALALEEVSQLRAQVADKEEELLQTKAAARAAVTTEMANNASDHLLGLKPTTISYRALDDKVKMVEVAGSFNNWNTRMQMVPGEMRGMYTTDLYLYPGTYQIKYIVNGENWVIDENAPTWGEGLERNNVIVVEE